MPSTIKVETREGTPLLKEELEFLADMMLGNYIMRWRRIQFRERDPYLGSECYESPAGKRIPTDCYGQRDAAGEIRLIAEKGIDCSIVLPDLIRCLEQECWWPVASHAGRAISEMVLTGTDCSRAVPALRKYLEKPKWGDGDARKQVEAALDTIENSSEWGAMKLRHSPDFMKARITGVARLLELIGLLDAGHVVIADGNSSRIYMLFGRRRFSLRGVPTSISVHPTNIVSSLKTNTLALSFPGRFAAT